MIDKLRQDVPAALATPPAALARRPRWARIACVAAFVSSVATGATPDEELPSRTRMLFASTTASGADLMSPATGTRDADTLAWRTGAVVTGAAVGLAVYGSRRWWRDGLSGNFQTVREGWFGADTELGGADKLGHAFSNYVGTRALAWAFREMGHDRDRALRLGLITTVGAFTAIELIDGYTKRWRFSHEDFLMNIAGAGLAYLTETHPELDALIDFRLLYRPSKEYGTRSSFDPTSDHSGQTYLLVLKGSGMPALRDRTPWRYLELAIGYRARAFEGVPWDQVATPSRHLYVGISLNVSELLDAAVFRGSSGRVARATRGILEFVQVPGTAAFIDRRL